MVNRFSVICLASTLVPGSEDSECPLPAGWLLPAQTCLPHPRPAGPSPGPGRFVHIPTHRCKWAVGVCRPARLQRLGLCFTEEHLSRVLPSERGRCPPGMEGGYAPAQPHPPGSWVGLRRALHGLRLQAPLVGAPLPAGGPESRG